MAIKTFLDTRNGTRAFQWSPPLGKAIFVKAGEYAITPKGGDIYALSVTFTQDFQP